jgi:hypothetical protein
MAVERIAVARSLCEGAPAWLPRADTGAFQRAGQMLISLDETGLRRDEHA